MDLDHDGEISSQEYAVVSQEMLSYLGQPVIDDVKLRFDLDRNKTITPTDVVTLSNAASEFGVQP